MRLQSMNHSLDRIYNNHYTSFRQLILNPYIHSFE